jgi:hypothetical protein
MDFMQEYFDKQQKIEDLVDSIRHDYVIIAYHTDTFLMAGDTDKSPEEIQQSIIEASVGLLKLKTDAEKLVELLYPFLQQGA